MINLSIPFWLMGTIVCVICLGLLGVALLIGYKIRKLKYQGSEVLQSSSITTAMLNNHFQHNLLAMQIDAVFNSLNALIETERIKLKALVAPSLQPFQAVEPPADEAATFIDDAETSENQQPHEPIVGIIQHDISEEINRGEDLSNAELELAEKMRSFQKDEPRKLEAVA